MKKPLKGMPEPKDREALMTAREENATAEFSAAVLAKTRLRKMRRKRIRKAVIWLMVLGVLGFAGFVWVQKTRAEYRTVYEPYSARIGSVSNALSYTGALQLVDSVTYTAPSACKVREVYVARGDQVEAGTKLMRLSDGTTFTADFDGTVSTLDAVRGDEVAAGANLLKLVDFDHMRVNIRISAANIGEVQEGTECRVTVSIAGVSVRSRIGEIDFSTYSGNNTVYYTAAVDVDLTGQTGVYPGMQATVTVTREEASDVVILRAEAIATAPDNTAFVYKQQEDGSMAVSPVTLGVSNGSYVEIREGVADGETVYAVVKQDESAAGWAAFMQSTFGSRQVNPPANQRNAGPGGNGTTNNWNRNRNGN